MVAKSAVGGGLALLLLLVEAAAEEDFVEAPMVLDDSFWLLLPTNCSLAVDPANRLDDEMMIDENKIEIVDDEILLDGNDKNLHVDERKHI